MAEDTESAANSSHPPVGGPVDLDLMYQRYGPPPVTAICAEVSRLQVKRERDTPTPAQLHKARTGLAALIGRAPYKRLLPLFDRLRTFEDGTW